MFFSLCRIRTIPRKIGIVSNRKRFVRRLNLNFRSQIRNFQQTEYNNDTEISCSTILLLLLATLKINKHLIYHFQTLRRIQGDRESN